MRIAHVSTFPPQKCGIAFFANDLIQAMPTVENSKYVLHYGESQTMTSAGKANVTIKSELSKLGANISRSESDIVCLQHEFGIWGGADGEYLLEFLQETTKPVVSILHTVTTSGTNSAIKTQILRELVRKSAATIVLTNRSRNTLCNLLQLPLDSIGVVPHGIPNLKFSPLEPAQSADQILRLVSVGFFRPDKGIEIVLQALDMARERGLKFLYKIVGSPQPQFPEQIEYFQRIQRLILDLRLTHCVQLDGKYLTREEQLLSIQHADAAMFAYQEPGQASSGVLALVLAASRPALCTPFEFAISAASETEAVYLSKDFTATALLEVLLAFASRQTDWDKAGRRAFYRTRAWIWPNVSKKFLQVFEKAISKPNAETLRA